MIIPRVHWNGTSREELLKQLHDATAAVSDAITAMAKATPHGRDYYIISHEATKQAQDEHYARMNKLHEVVQDLIRITEGVAEQRKR